jgi:hypothetical protein
MNHYDEIDYAEIEAQRQHQLEENMSELAASESELRTKTHTHMRSNGTPDFTAVSHHLQDRRLVANLNEYFSGGDLDFIDASLHPSDTSETRVYQAPSGRVAISVGHATLWVTPIQAKDIAAAL